MGRYVDAFVIPIKKKDIKAYKKMATIGRNIWMKYGALDYHECIAANIKSPYGIPFTKLCKLKPNETLIFAYITYKSKAHRNSVNKKVHQDPMMQPDQYNEPMPFDMKRFTVGEFKTLVEK